MVTRLALLGAGRIGKVHAKAIAEDKRAPGPPAAPAPASNTLEH